MKHGITLGLLFAAVLVAGCSSTHYVRATAVGKGDVVFQAEEVKGGVASPLMNPRKVSGAFEATAQTIPPYMTIHAEGPVVELPGTVAERPGDVVVTQPPPQAPRAAPAPAPRVIILDGQRVYVTPVSQAPQAAPEEPQSAQDGFQCCSPGSEGPCALPEAPRAVQAAPCAPPAAVQAPCLPTTAWETPASPPMGLDGRPCGTPVYVGCSGVVGGNRPTPYGGLGDAIPPGSGCPPKAASACPTGIAAIISGLLDLFTLGAL